MKYVIELMIKEVEIKSRIVELGQEITKFYNKNNDTIVLIGILRSSFIFMADLCRQIQISHKIDFITTSSYGNNMLKSSNIKILKNIDENIKDANVLIIEDIIDSGHTLNETLKIIKSYNPKSVTVCTLLDKPYSREIEVPIKFIGFSIPNVFVVGYGIDYAQLYRNLPYIAKIIPLNK